MKGYSALTVWAPQVRGLSGWADLWSGISAGISGSGAAAGSLGGVVGSVLGTAVNVGIPLAVGELIGGGNSGSGSPAQVPQNVPVTPIYSVPQVQPVAATSPNYTWPIVAGVLGIGMLLVLTRK